VSKIYCQIRGCNEVRRENHTASHHPNFPRILSVVTEHPEEETPAERVIHPEERIDNVQSVEVAYICNAGVGEAAVPLVLNAGDLAVVVEDVDLAVDGGLFADALDLVHGGHVHLDGVAG
jgi:hypothetical protein